MLFVLNMARAAGFPSVNLQSGGSSIMMASWDDSKSERYFCSLSREAASARVASVMSSNTDTK
jgi:hypothetical protein